MQAASVPSRLGRRRLHLPRTGSTMDDLLALARIGAPEGTVVTTDYQETGQGRAGRRWDVPPGSALLMSVLLRPSLPAAALTPLSLLVALAVADTLRDTYDIDARIKWPNDIFVGGRKICGVLLRTHAIAGAPFPIVIVGTGINANVPREAMPEAATSLACECGEPVDVVELRDRLLASLDRIYRAFLAADVSPAWTRLESLLVYGGERVTVLDGEREITGILAGIDPRGGLLLRLPDATIATVISGDLTRGPRPA